MAEKQFVSKRGLKSTKTRLLRSALAIFAFTVVLGSALFKTVFGTAVTVAALAVAAIALVTVFVIERPERFRWYRLPAPIVLYMLFSLIAIAWASDRVLNLKLFGLQLLITLLAVLVAYLITWAETLRTLATALRYLLVFSVAVWVWQMSDQAVTEALGLGLTAVMGFAVFGVQAFAGLQRPAVSVFWVLFSVLALVLDRSTIAFAAFGVVAISFVFTLWARKARQDHRVLMYVVGISFLTLTLAFVTWKRDVVAPALGISIATVQSENVWTQVLERSGTVGLILFIMVVFVTTWRTWFRAVDQPRRGAGAPLEYATSALWPFLLTTSLLVFSLVAATLVSDAGWFLLVLFAVKTRFDYIVPAAADDARKLAWRNVPLMQEDPRLTTRIPLT